MKKCVAAGMILLALPCVAWSGDPQQVKPLKMKLAPLPSRRQPV